MAVYPERRSGRLTGKWIAEVTRNGERIARKRFDLKRDADRFADTLKLSAMGATVVELEPVATGPTFREVAADAKVNHAAWQRDRDPSRWQRLDYVLDNLGDLRIAEITTADIDKLVATLRGRKGPHGKLAPGTINRYLTVASAVFEHAERRKHLQSKPHIPWQKEEGEQFNWLSEEGEHKVCAYLIEHGCPHDAATVQILIATGLRWGEFESLELGQIDGGWIRLWKTKTDTPRSVPIPIELSEVLATMIRMGTRPTYYTFRKRLKRAMKAAGQNPKRAIHTLRHTTATRLVQKGVNLRIVQRFMGHKNIVTTTRYAHVHDDDLLAAAEKLSQHAGQITVRSEIGEELPLAQELENSEDRCRVRDLNSRPTVYKDGK